MVIDDIKIKLDNIVDIAQEAGEVILKIYNQDTFLQQVKSDNSPLTEADIASHQLIEKKLKKLTPTIPILSEESCNIPYDKRKKWQCYWLIDPLDGTKEFIKRNGEFTVNIALINNHNPVLGVVHAPALEQTWFAESSKPANKITNGIKTVVKVKKPCDGGTVKIVGSRSHAGDSLNNFLKGFKNYELLSIGSSIKLCLVADGAAHLYPRFGLTSEWDTAAAHAIVNSAGGEVINANTKLEIEYNTKDSLLNPHFIVQSKSSHLLS